MAFLHRVYYTSNEIGSYSGPTQGLKLWACSVQKASSFTIGLVVWVTWASSNKHFQPIIWAWFDPWVHHLIVAAFCKSEWNFLTLVCVHPHSITLIISWASMANFRPWSYYQANLYEFSHLQYLHIPSFASFVSLIMKSRLMKYFTQSQMYN